MKHPLRIFHQFLLMIFQNIVRILRRFAKHTHSSFCRTVKDAEPFFDSALFRSLDVDIY